MSTAARNHSNSNADIINYKVVFLGEQNVGKSSIILRYFGQTLIDEYSPTIGIDFCSKVLEKNDRMIRLSIWDTAGQERFRTLISTYLRDCHIAIVVYDITSVASFESLIFWFNYIQKECGDRVQILLIGNKLDLESERKVSKDDGENFAKSFTNCSFIEASAIKNQNVQEVFDIVTDFASKLKPKPVKSGRIQVSKEAEETKSGRSCLC